MDKETTKGIFIFIGMLTVVLGIIWIVVTTSENSKAIQEQQKEIDTLKYHDCLQAKVDITLCSIYGNR